jgi:predicted amino acid dehydrogenase
MLAAALRDAGRAAERRADLAAAEARRLGIDIVAAGNARHALAREQHDVQQRRREADRGLDAAAVGELSRRPVGHGGRF